jgi:hypothetical protein
MNILNNFLNVAAVAALVGAAGFYAKENFAFDPIAKENIAFTVVGVVLSLIVVFTVKEITR